MWCNISNAAEGEIWNWSLLGVRRLKTLGESAFWNWECKRCNCYVPAEEVTLTRVECSNFGNLFWIVKVGNSDAASIDDLPAGAIVTLLWLHLVQICAARLHCTQPLPLHSTNSRSRDWFERNARPLGEWGGGSVPLPARPCIRPNLLIERKDELISVKVACLAPVSARSRVTSGIRSAPPAGIRTHNEKKVTDPNPCQAGQFSAA